MKFIGGAQPSVMMMLEQTSHKILIDTLKKFLGNHWLHIFNQYILSCKHANVVI